MLYPTVWLPLLLSLIVASTTVLTLKQSSSSKLPSKQQPQEQQQQQPDTLMNADLERLCDAPSPDASWKWKIVGIGHLPPYLWMILQVRNQYRVYQFDQSVVLSTVIDLRKVNTTNAVYLLQKLWPGIGADVRPNGSKRITTMFAVGNKTVLHDLDEQKLVLKSGGIVFRYKDRSAQVYDLSAKQMLNLSDELFSSRSIHKSATLAPMLNTEGVGAVFHAPPIDYWQYTPVLLEQGILWSQHGIHLYLIEGPSLKWLPQFGDLARLWWLIGPKYNATGIEANNPSDPYRTPEWKWAQGFVGRRSGGLVHHLFTDKEVYVFISPVVQEPMIGAIHLNEITSNNNKNNNEYKPMVFELRVLKLTYDEYFVCHKKYTASDYDIAYQYLLQYRPISHPANSSRIRSRIIFILFVLHFLVATIMLASIVVYSVKRPHNKPIDQQSSMLLSSNVSKKSNNNPSSISSSLSSSSLTDDNQVIITSKKKSSSPKSKKSSSPTSKKSSSPTSKKSPPTISTTTTTTNQQHKSSESYSFPIFTPDGNIHYGLPLSKQDLLKDGYS